MVYMIHLSKYGSRYDRGVQSPLTDWVLDPEVVHLNHGSYGGCPRAVFDAAAALRLRLERARLGFLVRVWKYELDRARARVAAFVGTEPDRLAFVPSATTGVAIALASAAPADGDDVVTTSHAYRACKNQLARTPARTIVVPVELPYDPDRTADAILAAVTPRCKLALLDHITSPTALRMPLERVVPALAARGVQTIVDGAHAPGQIALAIDALGASWYVGNSHKWVCAPKGTGFVVAAPAVAARTRPVVTSHGASPEYGPPNRYHAELDWAGTHDPTPHLAVPVAIDTIAHMAGSWERAIAHNHALVVEMRARLLDGLGGGTPLARDADLGAMAAVPIDIPTTPLALQAALLDAGWEIPIVDFASGPLVRVSAHLYTEAAQADALARELRARGVRAR